MTFQQFNLTIQRDPTLGRLLPLQLRRTYPRFSLENGKLALSFVGYSLVRAEGGLCAKAPAYYLRLSYPACRLLAFVQLPAAAEGEPLLPQSAETMERLTAQCDRVLACCDEVSGELADAVNSYNEVLSGVLTGQQRSVLDRFSALAGESL